MAAQQDPVPNGVFINDLHAPLIRVSQTYLSGHLTLCPVWCFPARLHPTKGSGAPTASRWRL
jgi:hypothetical protein